MDQYHRHSLRTEVPFRNSRTVPMVEESQGIECRSAATTRKIFQLRQRAYVKQHYNFHKTNTYATLTPLRYFRRAVRYPQFVSVAGATPCRRVVVSNSLRFFFFFASVVTLLTAKPQPLQAAASRLAYCYRQLRHRLRAKCSGDTRLRSGSGQEVPVPAARSSWQDHSCMSDDGPGCYWHVPL